MKSSLPHLILSIAIALCAIGGAIALGAIGGVAAAAEEEALAVIVHPSTKVTSLSADELDAIYRLSLREWPSGQAIIAFNHMPGTPLRASFDRVVLRMGPDEVARYWIDRRIRGFGGAPRKAPSVMVMLRVVSRLAGSIGYVPESQVTPDVRVVARIVHGRVMPAAPQTGAQP